MKPLLPFRGRLRAGGLAVKPGPWYENSLRDTPDLGGMIEAAREVEARAKRLRAIERRRKGAGRAPRGSGPTGA